jgi:hypothetical protein
MEEKIRRWKIKQEYGGKEMTKKKELIVVYFTSV